MLSIDIGQALWAVALVCASAWPAMPASAQPAPDYAQDALWLCRPGRQDLCAAPIDRLVLAADGSRHVERLLPDAAAAVDCFYVYPTVSTERTGHSGLQPGPGEQRAVTQQFAPFASVCRPFAPMYRQVTLAGLASRIGGQPMDIDPALGWRDVQAAWRHYLAHDNQGRGVVLVGHSQGSRMLVQLLQREIEGRPAQALLVSALLPGFDIEVPTGADRGATFAQLPLCSGAGQTGCVVGYASFRASAPPPDNARFGRSRKAGRQVACVDPVALTGGTVRSLLPLRQNLLGMAPAAADWQAMAGTQPVTTLADLPGRLQARCVSDGAASYLAFSLMPDVADVAASAASAAPAEARARRPADVPGDLRVGGRVLADWGLHLVDVNLVAGNLLQLVRQQSAAWLQAHPGRP